MLILSYQEKINNLKAFLNNLYHTGSNLVYNENPHQITLRKKHRCQLDGLVPLSVEVLNHQKKIMSYFYRLVLRKIFWRVLPSDVVKHLLSFVSFEFTPIQKCRILEDVFYKPGVKLEYEPKKLNQIKPKVKENKRKYRRNRFKYNHIMLS